MDFLPRPQMLIGFIGCLAFAFGSLENALAQGEINVQAAPFLARGDGLTDDTEAIRRAIAAAPTKRYGWSGGGVNRPEHGTTIFFPSPKVCYRITATIIVPPEKNLRFLGPTSHSARISLDRPGESCIFQLLGASDRPAGDGQQPQIFEKLIFHRGGIEFGEGNRRFIAVRDCVFNDTPGAAIRTRGKSVIAVEVTSSQFTECQAGIDIAFQQSDLWTIKNCHFVRNRGVDLHLATSGVHVRDCDFEVRGDHDRNFAAPFVHIESDRSPQPFAPGNDLVFNACRFGNEPYPPRACVVVGPLENVSSSVAGPIWFRDCLFRGANGAFPSGNQGRHAIVLNMPTHGMRIEGCHFFPYDEFVAENFLEGDRIASLKPDYNYWTNNTGQPLHNVFTHGGRGWYLAGPLKDQLRPTSPGRPTTNLLVRTEDIESDDSPWKKEGIELSRIESEPFPSGSPSYRVQRLAGQSAFLSSAPAALSAGPLVFSVWLKAGGIESARLAILELPGNKFVSSSPLSIIRLRPEWQRFSVVAPQVSGQASYVAQVFVGPDRASVEIDRDNNSGIVRNKNLVRVTLMPGQRHVFQPGDQIQLAGSASDHFQGEHRVLEALSPHQFTFSQAGKDETSGGGTCSLVGDIYMAHPQLEVGFEPTPFIANQSEVPHAQLPFQTLRLGLRSMIPGDAPPQTGRYEVGDIVWSQTPRSGEPIGWVCVEGGVPGNWRPFARIE